MLIGMLNKFPLCVLPTQNGKEPNIIGYCRGKGFTHTASYLENAHGDMFTAIENRLEGKTTSRVERLFWTVNIRVNVSKWSTGGVLNIAKVRLALQRV